MSMFSIGSINGLSLAKHRQYKKAVRVLRGLPDNLLADIGISRGGIEAAAREAVYDK